MKNDNFLNYFFRAFLAGLFLWPVCSLKAQEAAPASAAYWIWYPGDYPIWLSNKVEARRTDRGSFFPPFWKLDAPFPLMDFHRTYTLKAADSVYLSVQGRYNVKIDGITLDGFPRCFVVPKGTHTVRVKVFSQSGVPSLYMKGKEVKTDSTWLVTPEDKEWIDASGRSSGQSGTSWMQAEYWSLLNNPEVKPTDFRLPVRSEHGKILESRPGFMLVDFGKESFGYAILHGLTGKGHLDLYYGESMPEALSVDSCETLDRMDVRLNHPKDTVMGLSKAFRYLCVRYDPTISLDSLSMSFEYNPEFIQRGSFRCSDTSVNHIYDVALYTLSLCSREFMLDGIKRDRWIWSGDAYQAFLMNYYASMDRGVVSRTLWALRQKDPVTSHVNTIMDYSFYWFMAVYDYYLYTGDSSLVRQLYPRMQTLMDYCLSRRDKDSLMRGLPGDWVFVDWADGLSKKGALSFEQLLLYQSFLTMEKCAELSGDSAAVSRYHDLAQDMKKRLFTFFWDGDRKVFRHNYDTGQLPNIVNKYTNLFAIREQLLDSAQMQSIGDHVLMNSSIPKIVTPYMQFYELEALLCLGKQSLVLHRMKDYWGGMLKRGATSFWEQYDPEVQGNRNYAMYGRAFGKSLCHAWGAGPIYLLGHYYLGIRPTRPGYAAYEVIPQLGGLEWMKGKVPTPFGEISLDCTKKRILLYSDGGDGKLIIQSKSRPVCADADFEDLGGNKFALKIIAGKHYDIRYHSSENN